MSVGIAVHWWRHIVGDDVLHPVAGPAKLGWDVDIVPRHVLDRVLGQASEAAWRHSTQRCDIAKRNVANCGRVHNGGVVCKSRWA